MYLVYKLKNGEYVRVYVGDVLNVLEGNENKGVINAYIADESNEEVKSTFMLGVSLDKETNKPYFKAFNQKIYFEDYEAVSVDELCNRLENDRIITLDELVATFIKYEDKIGFVETREKENKAFQLLCHLTQDKYRKKNWVYNIETIPLDESSADFYGTQAYALSDYYNMMRNGEVEVINMDRYISDSITADSVPYARRREKNRS